MTVDEATTTVTTRTTMLTINISLVATTNLKKTKVAETMKNNETRNKTGRTGRQKHQ